MINNKIMLTKMSSINRVLSNILNKQTNFCCLCLDVIREDDGIQICDEVAVNVNGSERMLRISEVLENILGAKTYQYVIPFQTMCDKCIGASISSYTFIQTSQQNAEYMASCIEALANSIQHTTDNPNSKSLYVTLNLNDFTSKQLYDCKQIPNNTKAILKRFQAVENTSRMKLDTRSKMKKKYKFRKCLDMLLDPNDPDTVKCKECFHIYPHIWSLKSHYMRVHAPKTFKCPKCSCSYGSKSLLVAHQKESHCTMVCSECGKTFHNRHTYKMHELGHNLSIICPDCGRKYKNKTTFRKHKELNVCGRKSRANPAEAQFTCDYCNKKYTQKVSLRVHIQYEHGNYKAHVCEWCGKKFWAQSRLKAHIVKHTKERNFKCSICGGKFVTKESLLYHTRTHTGERPYECSECGTRFLSASRRSEHVKRHHTGATFDCNICHGKFNSVAYLQKHKRVHENKQDKVLEVDNKAKHDEANTSKDIKVANKNLNSEIVYKCEKSELFDDSTQSDDGSKVYLQVIEEEEDEYFIKIQG